MMKAFHMVPTKLFNQYKWMESYLKLCDFCKPVPAWHKAVTSGASHGAASTFAGVALVKLLDVVSTSGLSWSPFVLFAYDLLYMLAAGIQTSTCCGECMYMLADGNRNDAQFHLLLWSLYVPHCSLWYPLLWSLFCSLKRTALCCWLMQSQLPRQALPSSPSCAVPTRSGVASRQ